jgi:tRNA (adenine22-N1)-methyltransferase
MMIKLSKRLQMIAERVPQGDRLADIGSDHALLPTYLAERSMISFAVAGEVNKGPYEAAQRQVRAARLGSSVIEVRLGDGLAVIQPGEIDTVTIAGMGGALIASILEAGKTNLKGVKTLVLQPNVGEDQVRRWFDANGWLLTEEAILEEDGKIYEILTAVPLDGEAAEEKLYRTRNLSEGITLDKELLFRLGPYLVLEADPIWISKWQSELAKLELIAKQMRLSDQEAARERERELQGDINRIKGVLQCLQKARQ